MIQKNKKFLFANSTGQSENIVLSGPTSGNSIYNSFEKTLVDLRTGKESIVVMKGDEAKVPKCHQVAPGIFYARTYTNN